MKNNGKFRYIICGFAAVLLLLCAGYGMQQKRNDNPVTKTPESEVVVEQEGSEENPSLNLQGNDKVMVGEPSPITLDSTNSSCLIEPANIENNTIDITITATTDNTVIYLYSFIDYSLSFERVTLAKTGDSVRRTLQRGQQFEVRLEADKVFHYEVETGSTETTESTASTEITEEPIVTGSVTISWTAGDMEVNYYTPGHQTESVQYKNVKKEKDIGYNIHPRLRAMLTQQRMRAEYLPCGFRLDGTM